MPDTKDIPDKIIQRLPHYYVQLKKLLSDDTEYISSEKLSKIMGYSSSLIRRDLSHFGSFGKKSYGYDINCLYETISKILGFSSNKKMIIIGAGFLGRALANNKSYKERGYELIGLFDKDPAIIGLEFNGLQVMDIEFAPGFIKQNQVEVAALAVPSDEAQKAANLLINSGIKGIWDFTETPISVPDDIILVEQNMNDGLCKLSCRLMQKSNECSEQNE
ncbi:redox-sensing transcriptional repressor Rex [Halanaerobiaceae bacterium Z-7014]|uniref:Redox-sensing transcriptional repressor Rex n=1 Tax=Halonatronomonas betaini TaxID=2778430 RepID=A0A931AXM3_9FIRM|nr:redox-sensing transcriptional repressor Rex [Halonatronomonas betaini]MBF8437911.1 redox-sensing transcriptional repressor Rex [Halonatronomonas betaini]